MIRALLRWARARRVAILGAAFLLAIASAFAVRRLSFDANVLRLLPREGTAAPAFRGFLERFGSLDFLYVVFEVPEGASIEEYDAEIAAFGAALARAPEIERVDLGPADPSRDWGYVAERLLLIVGPQLSEALGRFEGDGLAAQLARTRELLSLPSDDITRMVRSDPLGLFLLMRERLAGAAAGIRIDASGGAYASADGRARLVLAKPRRPPFDTDFSKQLFARLAEVEREALDAPDAGGDRPLRVRFAGGHAIALEIERTVRQESIWNGVTSLALILPLLYYAFRSPWLVFVGPIPSALAILVVLAIYALLGVTLSAAATGAGAMQFGLGVDGVVLLFVAYRHLASTGLATDQAAAGLDGPSASMLLGMWTTAATFYGLAVVDFPSLEELGLLIGHSMVLCGLFTLVLIPALLPRRAPRTSPLTTWWLPRFVARHSRAILAAGVLATLGLGAAAFRLQLDPSLDRLRARTPGTAFEDEVARRFGVPTDVYLVVAEGDDLEPLLEANEALATDLARSVPGLDLHPPTAILPSQRAQAEAARQVTERGLSSAAVAAALRSTAADAGFRPGTFDPFLARLPRLLDPDERLTYDGFHAHGLGDLLARSVVRQGSTWTTVLYAYADSPGEVEALRQRVQEAGGRLRLTGVPEVNRELGRRFGPEFLKGLALGTALVILMVAATFRRAGPTLLALAPTAIALVWAAGILALAGVALDLFSMFAVMTFVGIGVDYGIHMVHRHTHAAPGRGDEAVAQLGPVILVAAATTLLGFGTLVTSSYPPLRSLGLVSTVMVLTLALASLLVLPALLLRRRSP